MAFQTFAFNTRYCQESHAVIRKIGEYQDGSTALEVYSSEGEPLSRVTVCMAGYDETPRDGMVFIKDYADNEGVFEALHEAGIVGQPERWLDAGYAKNGVAEAELLVEVTE